MTEMEKKLAEALREAQYRLETSKRLAFSRFPAIERRISKTLDFVNATLAEFDAQGEEEQ